MMKLRTNAFDLWVFQRDPNAVRYLLLYTSQEKADKWFNGGRFWQIPGGVFGEDEPVVEALSRVLRTYQLMPRALWAVEHVSTIYNRRHQALELIPVFAAEVGDVAAIPLTWEHAEYRWLTAEECRDRLTFRGLVEGLEWTRAYITEPAAPRAEFRLA